jgi:hypothetical protein
MKKVFAVLTFTLCASAVQAEPPKPSADAQAVSQLVHDKLIDPLKKQEDKRNRFSRAVPVPKQRRVRVSEEHEVDTRGEEFVRFAVDQLRDWDDEYSWHERIVGCVYPGKSKIFVKRDEDYLPASSLLGKDVDPQPGACRSAAQAAAPSVSGQGQQPVMGEAPTARELRRPGCFLRVARDHERDLANV